jgi:hypothetical protein
LGLFYSGFGHYEFSDCVDDHISFQSSLIAIVTKSAGNLTCPVL